LASRLGIRVQAEPVRDTAPVTPEQVIELWKKDRKQVAKPGAIREKIRVMRELFGFLKDRIPVPDLAAVTKEDLQRYKESFAEGEGYDTIVGIKALFTVAKNNNKLPDGNPAEEITNPAKRQKSERAALTDDEARDILNASRHGDPVVKWCYWLAAFTGMITSEIVNAGAFAHEVEVGDRHAAVLSSAFLT